MSRDLQIWIAVSGIFVAVAVITMVTGSYILRRERIRSRLALGTVTASEVPGGALPKLIERIDNRLVGLNPEQRTKLRFELLRAGYFSPDAPKIFVVTRALLIIALPLGGFILSGLVVTNISLVLQMLLFGILMYLGYAGPDAYVKRCQAGLLKTYLIVFPDFLDLLVVCMDSGLSFEAALVRIGREFNTQSPEFATNLALLSSEMRSGRGTIEALDNLSDRLGLQEMKSFSMLLKQSIELGSDISDGLRIFADDMRDKRMSRAEEMAYALPVKMTIPLGLFIFPVMLIEILTPALIKLASAFKTIAIGG
jgi:tight adherence protein C